MEFKKQAVLRENIHAAKTRYLKSHRRQHLPFQVQSYSLKNFQRHADIVKLLPAFVDILQARHHEIPVRKKTGRF